MQELIDKAFIVLVAVGGLYFMIFHTQKCEEVTRMQQRNIGTVAGAAFKVGKGAFSIFRMLMKK